MGHDINQKGGQSQRPQQPTQPGSKYTPTTPGAGILDKNRQQQGGLKDTFQKDKGQKNPDRR